MIDNQVNLCNSCCFEIPTCIAADVTFGDGAGNDNVCTCPTYVPLAFKSPRGMVMTPELVKSVMHRLVEATPDE